MSCVGPQLRFPEDPLGLFIHLRRCRKTALCFLYLTMFKGLILMFLALMIVSPIICFSNLPSHCRCCRFLFYFIFTRGNCICLKTTFIPAYFLKREALTPIWSYFVEGSSSTSCISNFGHFLANLMLIGPYFSEKRACFLELWVVEKEFPEVNKCCKMLQDLLQVLGRFLLVLVLWHMGVSKIRVPQNWMVYNGKTY